MEKIKINWNSELPTPFNLDLDQYRVNENARIENAYKVLRLPNNSQLEAIEKNYRDLIKENHPDKFTSKDKDAIEKATSISQVINEARSILIAHLETFNSTDYPRNEPPHSRTNQPNTSPEKEQSAEERELIQKELEETFATSLEWQDSFREWKDRAEKNGLNSETIQGIINRGLETEKAKENLTKQLVEIISRESKLKFGNYDNTLYHSWMERWNKALNKKITKENLDVEKIKSSLKWLITQRIDDSSGDPQNLLAFKEFWITTIGVDLISEVIKSPEVIEHIRKTASFEILGMDNPARYSTLINNWNAVGLKLDIINSKEIQKLLEGNAYNIYNNKLKKNWVNEFISFVEKWKEVGWKPNMEIENYFSQCKKAESIARLSQPH